ncbi:MAG: di-heme oxidoredictase family protein [Geminicoccaceae bacterium]
MKLLVEFAALPVACAITAAGPWLWSSAAVAEVPAPIDQKALNAMVARDPLEAFIYAFEAGDELTEALFTAERGVGAHVAAGQRFTRYPRADLKGDGEWAQHVPAREGGPQAQACITCHALPYANGAGDIAVNVAIDPLQSGDMGQFLERNTLHLFGLGAVQRVAEEMTAELHAQEAGLAARVCADGAPASIDLVAKDVGFGTLAATPAGEGNACVAAIDRSGVEGADGDLVVRMFGWKGTQATIRAFSRGAAHNEMGMQAVELVGDHDGDFDGVTRELSVGDMTAMSVYIAGLERPTSKRELADLGLYELSDDERAAIDAGEQHFAAVGCASCHKPIMTIDDPVYREPSATPGFAEAVMPDGMAADAHGLGLANAVRFDLTTDQPNNHVLLEDGIELNLGAYESDDQGRAIVRWYTDFRRHDMGEGLADPVDAYGFGASVWPTRSLAGVGSTGPWLHHGHATTLDEAIRAHGGAADDSRTAYEALPAEAQAELIAFLENLIIVDLDPEEDEADH